MSGLFGTLNIGKSGMFAQQGAINTTSHNIANATTEGYSRQRVELQTTRPYCMPSMNSTAGPGQVGTGVQIVAINRVRDSFIDYQTRVSLGVQGDFSIRDKILSQIENTMKEPTDAAISHLLGEMFKSWQDLSVHPQTYSAKNMVMQQALALADELNHTFNELSKLKENTQMEIQQTVYEVNGILDQINQLNEEITQVKVAGQQPNDLLDRRDLLLDQLSQKFGMEINRENFEGISLTTSNDPYTTKEKILSAGGEPPKIKDKNGKLQDVNLIQTTDPKEVYRFSYIQDIKPKGNQKQGATGEYTVTYYIGGDTSNKANERTLTINITSEDDFKRLDECRVIWTDKDGKAVQIKDNHYDDENNNEITGTIDSGNCNFKNLKLFEPPSGELRGQMSVQQNIDEYQDKLNKLAKSLAFSVNAIHSQNDSFNVSDNDTGANFFVNGTEDPTKEDEITAGNITINKVIKEDPMKIIAGVTANSGEGDGKRAIAIGQLKDIFMSIQGIENDTTRNKFLAGFFKENSEFEYEGTTIKTIQKDTNGMTMDNYFNNIIGDLGKKAGEAKRMVKNQAISLAGFQSRRDSVSGVSLDEEFANLVQFNHCYQANAKIISTVAVSYTHLTLPTN